MAMGKRKKHRQQPLFVVAGDLPKTPGHPFYGKLNDMPCPKASTDTSGRT